MQGDRYTAEEAPRIRRKHALDCGRERDTRRRRSDLSEAEFLFLKQKTMQLSCIGEENVPLHSHMHGLSE